MSGEGAMAHGWGNSLLKNRKTNKVRYFDRWNESKIFYQGKEVGFKGMEALMAYYLDKQQDGGLSNDEIININIEKRMGRVLFDKKKELESEVFALNAKGLSNPNGSTISQSEADVKFEQRAYVSMKNELVGEYLDADRFEMSGEGAMAHGWGNYLLKDRKTNKVRYYVENEKWHYPSVFVVNN